ncbi:unnamed protein product [Blumeria hordei]|uniref:guanosine-diphosphatase n=1 Tax=Blumeria hordei TaxID=2867405 RepID=A0A383UQ55_BLUHO|nr:unnamed protein product [Blumeria hordei]
MRRISVSQNSKEVERDPHEKLARYQTSGNSAAATGARERARIVWMPQTQRSRYVRTGGILLFVVFLFYYFLPHRTSFYGEVTKLENAQIPSESFSETKKCTKPYEKSKPLIQYVLMIDAGSTGSRIHIYKFNNCGPTPELEHEEFKMTEKKSGGSGLSSYKTDADGAAKSLDVLLDVAMKNVPDKYKACSPIAVKATAGLRLLGQEMSQKILDAVRTRLETVYPFPVVSSAENGVAIMDGKDEGVYAWITTNYLLGKIGGTDQRKTAAILDLGGGSTQIVFEPDFQSLIPDKLKEGEHKYNLSFGGRVYELYQHSHLGYGLMSAREAIHKTLIEDIHTGNPEDSAWIFRPIINPCIAPGMSRMVDIKLDDNHQLGKKLSVNMTGPSSPAPAQCRRLAEKILHKNSVCDITPCSFNGVYQPPLSKTFSLEEIYTFSYFYDRINVLGMPDSFTLNELHRLTEQVCGGESEWELFSAVPGAFAELQGRPEHCLDLNYIVALLHTGYEMPIEREIKIAKKIDNNELGWCLGASLPLLGERSGWECRVVEVS